MNKTFKTLFTLFLGILFFIPTSIVNSAEETIEDIVESLGEIQEEFSKLSPSDNKEADIIDQAIKEINKSTEFAIQSIEKEDTVTATSALSYIDKSLSDVGKIVPKEYESDMSKADIASFAPEKLTTLKLITDEMNKKKVVDTNELLDEIIELNSKGFNTTKISSTLNDLGIDTITLIELDNRKFSKLKNEIVDNQLSISEKEKKIKAMEALDTALDKLNSNRPKYGSNINRLKSSLNNLDIYNDLNAEYLSQAVSRRGIHEMTSEAAMEGVKSLGKSQTEWAAAWTGGAATHKNVNGVRIELSAEESQRIQAEWAMNRAAQAIQQGEMFTDGSITIDQQSITQASAAATQAAMANVQEQAANIATQVASSAEAIATLDTSSVAENVGESVKDVIASSEWLSRQAAEGTFTDLASVEDYLGISIETITQDTSRPPEEDTGKRNDNKGNKNDNRE